MKNKIVASEIQEERDKCNFDQSQMWKLFFHDNQDKYDMFKQTMEDMDSPYLQMGNTHKFYEMDREEMQVN